MFFLLKKLQFNNLAVAISLLIYLGLTNSHASLFKFFTQHNTFQVVIFISLYYILDIYQKYNTNIAISKFLYDSKTQLFILAVIACYMGYGTTKLILIFYLPILITHIVIYLKGNINKHCLSFDREALLCILLSILIFCSIVCRKISEYLHGDLFIADTGIKIANLESMLSPDNVSRRITELFCSFNLFGNIKLISENLIYINNILMVINIILVCYIIVYLLKYKNKDKVIYNMSLISLYFITSIACMIIFMFTTYSRITARYYFIIPILFPIFVGYIKDYASKTNLWWSKLLNLTIIVSIIIFSYITFPSKKYLNEDLYKISQDMVKDKYKIVNASYWNADIIKGYSNGAIEARHFANHITPYLWVTDMSLYTCKYQNEQNILLTTDKEEDNFDQRDREILKKGKFLKKIGKFNLYRYEKNILKIYELNRGQQLILYAAELHTDEKMDSIIDGNSRKSNGKPGHLIYGPYMTLKKGTYTIIINYVAQGEMNYNAPVGIWDTGIFDGKDVGPVFAGGEILPGTDEIKEKFTVTRNRVDNFQVRVYFKGIGNLRVDAVTIFMEK
jgi:hypothetical protein